MINMVTAQEEPKTELKTESAEPKEKKRISYGEILKTALSLAKELFIFSLIFYLILFVLETLFPGFVSHNFSLNWVLGIVVGLGVISAFAPEEAVLSPPGEAEKQSKKPKIVDYLTAIFLGLLGGFLLYYKIQLELTLRLIVAVISGVLIIALSLVLLLVEDEEIKEREEEIETFVQKTFLSRKTFTTPIAFFRLLLFKKVNFPVFLILIVFLFTSLALPAKSGVAPRKISLEKLTSFLKPASAPEPSVKSETLPSPTPTATQIPKKMIVPSEELIIKVLNGNSGKNTAEDFAKILKETGFVKVFFGNADNLQYQNALLKFRPEDKDQAELIKELLEKEYSTISEAPYGTTSAEITVILGKKTLTEVEEKRMEEEITILTPENE